MLILEARFGTGYYRASAESDPDREAEWPPDPARLLSALAASWGIAGEDPAERAALEWLEAQAPVSVHVPAGARQRDGATHYVPGNVLDYTKKGLGKHLFPGRDASARGFPMTWVPGGKVQFCWPAAKPDDFARGLLDGVAIRVARLGRSGSFASLRVLPAGEVPDPGLDRWVPGSFHASGAKQLRVARPGYLAELRHEHAAYLEAQAAGGGVTVGRAPYRLPAVPVFYSRQPEAAAPPVPSAAGGWLAFEFTGEKPGAWAATEIAGKVKTVLLSHLRKLGCPGDMQALFAGHAPDGSPLRGEHPAFWALPAVGHQRSDGRIMGAAVSVPASAGEQVWEWAQKAAGSWKAHAGCKLGLGGGRTLAARPVGEGTPRPAASVLRRRWAGPDAGTTLWASATPIALPRTPGDLNRGLPETRLKRWAAAAAEVARTVEGVGLPRPVAVRLAASAPGAVAVERLPKFRPDKKTRMVKTLMHACIEFEEPVSGPMALGAGRYCGLGLMLPVAVSGHVTPPS